MKKAILISGIIWAVVSIVLAIVFVLMGGLSLAKLSLSNTGSVSIDQCEYDPMRDDFICPQGENNFLIVSATALVVVGIWLFVAAAYSFVLVGLRNKATGKAGGIVLGIVGIVLGAELPGILTLIDSAKNR